MEDGTKTTPAKRVKRKKVVSHLLNKDGEELQADGSIMITTSLILVQEEKKHALGEKIDKKDDDDST